MKWTCRRRVCNLSMTRRALKCSHHSAASLIIHSTTSTGYILCDVYWRFQFLWAKFTDHVSLHWKLHIKNFNLLTITSCCHKIGGLNIYYSHITFLPPVWSCRWWQRQKKWIKSANSESEIKLLSRLCSYAITRGKFSILPTKQK